MVFSSIKVMCAVQGLDYLFQENIADKVIRKLKHRMKSLVVGNPLDKNTDVGAI